MIRDLGVLGLLALYAGAVTLYLAAPAYSQPSSAGHVPSGQPDAIEIRDSSEGHLAEIVYSNSADLTSAAQVLEMSHNGVTVRVRIIVGKDETLIVEPQEPDVIAVPPEIDVPDGAEAVVQLMRPLS